MNYPGRARIQEYAERAIKRLREDQISNKRQRVKERLSKGQFEEEAKSLASLMGMDEKEALKLISNKSMTPEQKIEQHYDFTKLQSGVQQDLVRAVTSDVGVGVAAGTTMTSGAAGLIALMQAMQGAQGNQIQREMPLQ
tara:strand:+ start:1349 stop:1765 length:417 start_codon:yes stop_codon:yes gene_type:complete